MVKTNINYLKSSFFSYICIRNKDSQLAKSNNRVISRLEVSEGLAQYILKSGYISGGQMMGWGQGLGLENQGQDQQAKQTFKWVHVQRMQFI